MATISKNGRKVNNLHNYKCVVPNCIGNGDKTLHFYGFPFGMPDVFEKWKKNLQMDKIDIKRYMNVCQLHFENSVIGKKKILKGGVPTLNLGHNNPIYLSCMTRRYRPTYWQESTFDDNTQQCLYLPDEFETFRFVKKADNDIDSITETSSERRKLLSQQIINIKFCYQLQKSSNETYQMLTQVYGAATLSRVNVIKIYARFREGWDVLPDGQSAPQEQSPQSSESNAMEQSNYDKHTEEFNEHELKYEYLEDNASVSSDTTVVIETVVEVDDEDDGEYYIE